MNIRGCLALLSALTFALAFSARAQNNQLEQKATVDDPKVLAILQASSLASEIDEKAARAIGPMLFADGALSVNERRLLLELLGNNSGTVAITGPAGESFNVPVLSRQARAFLSLVTPPDLSTLWLRGPAQMKQLVDITVLDPVITPRITGYIAQRLGQAWMVSTLSDGYKPLRDDFAAAVRQLQQTDPDTERRGRALVFDAARQLDRASGGAIPKYLYDYLGTN